MRIATKLNVAIFAVFVATVMMIYVVMGIQIKPQFDEIDLAHAKVNHNRVLEAIDALSEKLRSNSQDYGYWDASYDFMTGVNREEFVATNLEPAEELVENLGNAVVVFRRLDGSIEWATAYDLETMEPVPALRDEVAGIAYKHPYLSGQGDYMSIAGLVKTTHGLVLMSINPVLKANKSGSPVGEVIAASPLEVKAIRDLTRVDFSIELLDPAKPGASPTEAVHTVHDDNVETTSMLTDISGGPLAVLTIKTPRDVSAAGANAIWSATLMMIGAAATVILALWLFIRRMVVSRVVSLSRHITTAAAAGELRKFEGETSADEIGILARSFNGMADEVNHLRDALADSSYLAGMSEWAAGTLHNVRNGLNPLTVAAWQLQTLFDPGWLGNLKQAIDEQLHPDTTEARREKLRMFTEGTTARLLSAAENARGIGKRMEEQSRSIMDIMSEFERYARREVKLEQVDLRPLVSDVVRSVFTSSSGRIALSLPQDSIVVETNRTMLRQVLSNLVLNASEAIAAHGGEGRIDIGWTVDGGAEPRATLMVRDNGEGIAKSRLKSIFERGNSTRTTRSGGLGLHWCANAIASMGGSIVAESEGAGHGASLKITLPVSNARMKEAA